MLAHCELWLISLGLFRLLLHEISRQHIRIHYRMASKHQSLSVPVFSMQPCEPLTMTMLPVLLEQSTTPVIASLGSRFPFMCPCSKVLILALNTWLPNMTRRHGQGSRFIGSWSRLVVKHLNLVTGVTCLATATATYSRSWMLKKLFQCCVAWSITVGLHCKKSFGKRTRLVILRSTEQLSTVSFEFANVCYILWETNPAQLSNRTRLVILPWQ